MVDVIFGGRKDAEYLSNNITNRIQGYKWLIAGSTALATIAIQPAAYADMGDSSAAPNVGPVLAAALPQAKGAKAKAAKSKKPKATSIRDAFKKGKFSLGVRYRFHTISEDAKEFNATASTIRMRAGFRTAEYKGVSGYLEFDHTAIVGADDFNTPNVPRAGYPTIADPAITDLQQAYLDVKFNKGELRVGRMQPAHDDKRYLGPGNWRQNARNMDGVRFINKSLKDVTFKYYYHWNFNRQLGDSIPAGDWDTNAHLFFAEYAGIKDVKLSGFGYLLKVSDDPKQSSQTFGGRLHGKPKLGKKSKFLFDAHYAKQSDYSNNANDYSEHIFWGSAGVQTGPLTVKAGYENIGGDGTNAVRFATGGRHAFQGLADIFTAIPADGLKDVYGQVIYKMPDFGFMKKPTIHLQYHDFSAQNISADYGTEWDVRFTFNTKSKLGFRILYADFNSQGYKSDKKHFLVQINTKF